MIKKDKLYYDLIEAYRNHSCNDTLIDTYIYKVLKLVKDYLDFDKLKKENQELKDYIKALDKACEILDWDCPVSQELVDDLDCENCNDNYKECWKKYFLKEVLENEK